MVGRPHTLEKQQEQAGGNGVQENAGKVIDGTIGGLPTDYPA